MADWPKRIKGHFIDRELTSLTGNVEYRYHCIKCGLRVDGPNETGLELRPCDALTRSVGHGR